MRPWLKEVLLVKVKRSIERWNKRAVCYVQVVWFGTKGKVGPRYISLFLEVAGILEDSVSLRPSRVLAQGTQRFV